MKIVYFHDVQFIDYDNEIKTNQSRYVQKLANLTFLSTDSSFFIHFDVYKTTLFNNITSPC